jgi:hypothetical protein
MNMSTSNPDVGSLVSRNSNSKGQNATMTTAGTANVKNGNDVDCKLSSSSLFGSRLASNSGERDAGAIKLVLASVSENGLFGRHAWELFATKD